MHGLRACALFTASMTLVSLWLILYDSVTTGLLAVKCDCKQKQDSSG